MSFVRLALPATLAVLAAAAPAAQESLSDPMRPPVAAPHTEPSAPPPPPSVFDLRAIKIERGRASAIIDGQVVTEGSEINGAKVLKITREQVVIVEGDHTIELKLLKNEIKRRHQAPR